MTDLKFCYSVTKEGDSVVMSGKVPNLTTKYFNDFREALEYLREKTLKFIKEIKED